MQDGRLVGGIDEAGKGPVIGPMVVCLFEAEEGRLGDLKAAGAADSKTLTERRREEILEKLKGVGSWKLVIISAAELDARGMSLNKFEIGKMAALLSGSRASKVYIDSIEANGERLGEKVRSALPLERQGIEIIARPKADRDYPIVGAASIAAKVTREMEIAKLKEDWGDFGSGYPSDPRTRAFLKAFLAKGTFLPAIVRKSWSTVDSLIAEARQRRLG